MEDSLVMEEEGIWVPRVNIFMDSFKIVDQEKYTNIVLSVVMVGILSSIAWLFKLFFLWVGARTSCSFQEMLKCGMKNFTFFNLFKKWFCTKKN